MKAIELGKGCSVIVDDEDFELVHPFKWRAHTKGSNTYAVTRIDGHRIRMHRMILGASEGQCVDHRDRDGLNNQRSNLRIATVGENNRNKRPARGHRSSQYKGVSKTPFGWNASITVEGKCFDVGVYSDEATAACHYDLAALLLHKDFAATNSELFGMTYDLGKIINDSIEAKRSRLRPPKEKPPQRGEVGRLLTGQRFVSPLKASRFKGVSREGNIWAAQIKVAGRRLRLGSFKDEMAAARAYDDAARTYHKEKAVTNQDIYGPLKNGTPDGH